VRVDGLGSVMEPELNCSSQCESPLCFIHAGVNRQEGHHILQRLCSLSTVITLTHTHMHMHMHTHTCARTLTHIADIAFLNPAWNNVGPPKG